MEQSSNKLPEPRHPPSTYRLGRVFAFAAWFIALTLAMLFFKKHLDAQYIPEIMVSTSLTPNGGKVTILTRNRQHQYVAKGMLNQKDVIFLLDTGATDVVVPGQLAKQLKLTKGPKTIAQTAAGQIEIFKTRIESIVIGHIELTNVAASINPNMQSDEVLLGMSALKKLNFMQQGNKLILTKTP